MAKKRKPAYFKILDGMNHCYGTSDRDCSDCPYDRYNERDFYGMGTSYCMVKLNEDAKKWTESMTMFCKCEDCVCWKKNYDEDGQYDQARYEDKYGFCTFWNTVMGFDEFCSRGAEKYD